MSEERASIRLDKWLWYARFFKTRTLAAKIVGAGHVRVNGTKVNKAATNVRIGDHLSFVQADRARILTIVALGERRGPAVEAQALYDDQSPEPEPFIPAKPSVKSDRKGRPTKKDRRMMQGILGEKT